MGDCAFRAGFYASCVYASAAGECEVEYGGHADYADSASDWVPVAFAFFGCTGVFADSAADAFAGDH